MGSPRKVCNSEQVTALSRRVEKWRRARTSLSSAMPADLWDEAALLSRRYGVYRIASELGLGYSKLKKLAHPKDSRALSASHSPAGFVEISGLQLEDRKTESLMELELTSATGARLRLRRNGREPLDVAGVVEAFGRSFR